MRIYKVGGCVRDQLMCIKPKDIDYVVIGATPKYMLENGYEQVGKDFPVFLFNGCEYALARTEKKTGNGYNSFHVETSDVTLLEDLFRRDLTINAMALSENGELIDPYNGQKDLEKKILRHVSTHFKEDPVRILRIARFSARYDFKVAQETLELMKNMVHSGEFDYLTPERVWKEFEKVLNEPYLSNFFTTLEKIGALNKIPGFNEVKNLEFYQYISINLPTQIFESCLLHTFSQMNFNDLKKWKMPIDYQHLIQQYSSWKKQDNFYSNMSNEQKVSFIQQNKSLHSVDKSIVLINSIVAFHNWKESKENLLVLENDKFMEDVSKLKTLGYKSIVENALKNKIRPDVAVKKAQVQLLNNQHKTIIKL